MFQVKWVARGMLGAVAIAAGIAVAGMPAGAKPQSFGEILATRPAPDVTTLEKRADPANDKPPFTNPEPMEAFWDLLKLRENPDEKNLGVLVNVLKAHKGSTRILGFAAAQAIYAIGTPKAFAALDDLALQPSYSAQMGIMYAYHWEMNPEKRSGFIRRYHLKNLSRELGISVTAGAMEDNGLTLTVTVTNLTKGPLVLQDRPVNEDSIYFEDAQGRMTWTRENGLKEDALLARWITLAGGEKRETKIEMIAKALGEHDSPDPSLPADEKLMLQSRGTNYLVGKAGEFKAYALLQGWPMSAEARKANQIPDGPIFEGRAVSEPVKISVLTVK